MPKPRGLRATVCDAYLAFDRASRGVFHVAMSYTSDGVVRVCDLKQALYRALPEVASAVLIPAARPRAIARDIRPSTGQPLCNEPALRRVLLEALFIGRNQDADRAGVITPAALLAASALVELPVKYSSPLDLFRRLSLHCPEAYLEPTPTNIAEALPGLTEPPSIRALEVLYGGAPSLADAIINLWREMHDSPVGPARDQLAERLDLMRHHLETTPS